MFAVFCDGGRQYKVNRGDRLVIDYREKLAVGDSLKFDQVLLAGSKASSKIGAPVIEGAVVEAQILGHRKGDKLEIQKFKRRKKMRRHTGHRQKYTAIQITALNVPGLADETPAPLAAN
jgi:large subunit ribosomal protein L21